LTAYDKVDNASMHSFSSFGSMIAVSWFRRECLIYSATLTLEAKFRHF